MWYEAVISDGKALHFATLNCLFRGDEWWKWKDEMRLDMTPKMATTASEAENGGQKQRIQAT